MSNWIKPFIEQAIHIFNNWLVSFWRRSNYRISLSLSMCVCAYFCQSIACDFECEMIKKSLIQASVIDWMLDKVISANQWVKFQWKNERTNDQIYE